MRNRKCRGLRGGDLRRFAQRLERGADRALRSLKSLPFPKRPFFRVRNTIRAEIPKKNALERTASKTENVQTPALTLMAQVGFGPRYPDGRFLRYVRRLIAQRRAEPQDDMITALVQAREEGDKLNED